MKKAMCLFITMVFLCNNYVYAVSTSSFSKETLAGKSPFELISGKPSDIILGNLLRIVLSLDEEDIRKKITRLRDIFAEMFGDDPSGLTLMCNRENKEVFVFIDGKVVHIFTEKHTEISALPISSFSEAVLNIKLYDAEAVEEELGRIKNLVVVEGVLDLSLQKEAYSGLTDHVISVLKREGIYEEGKGLKDLALLIQDKGIRNYVLRILSIQGERDKSTKEEIRHAHYAQVPEGLPSFGWLTGPCVPDLEIYSGSDAAKTETEYRNAIKIRDYIRANGEGIDLKPALADYPEVRFKIWHGNAGEYKDLNSIIENNIKKLLRTLPESKRERLFKNLSRFTATNAPVMPGETTPAILARPDARSGRASVEPMARTLTNGEVISIAVLLKSRYWCENCRGDGFVGINIGILEKIKETMDAIANEMSGQKREEEINILSGKLNAFEAYLQTYIYHELRHEAFISETELLEDPLYAVDELGMVFNTRDMEPSDIKRAITGLDPDKRTKFEEMIEQRQNRSDAAYFIACSKKQYQEYLKYLLEDGVIDEDSVFLHAASIAGFVKTLPWERGLPKHYNELTIEDFDSLSKNDLAKKSYRRYEEEYQDFYKADKERTKSLYRDRVAYMLYRVGLTDYISIGEWREQNAYDRETAKKYIIRLIVFMARHERLTDTGRTVFRETAQPVPYSSAAQMLSGILLSSGDFSRAVFRTELAFKTNGLVNTITKTKFDFWQLIEEACKERTALGDIRFEGITAVVMKQASVEREIIPRLAVLSLFKGYLLSDLGKDFNKTYRDSLSDLLNVYYSYLKGAEITLDNDEIKQFDKVYAKAYSLLLEKYGIDKGVWADYSENDFLLALAESFDFYEHLTEGKSYKFSEPLLVTGGIGDETRFTIDELLALSQLKQFIEDSSKTSKRFYLFSAETAEKIRLILGIYHGKIRKYRNGMNNVLKRYGTERDINGNNFMDILFRTRGWLSALWLSREYAYFFRGEEKIRAVDIHSGASLFYKALFSYGLHEENLSELDDLIADPETEYFGINPSRLRGNLYDGTVINMQTGDPIEIGERQYELVTSIYEMHTIQSAQKIFRIFKNANKMLRYGGHFAVTMSSGKKFSDEALKVIADKLGFLPVFKPCVVWNELEDARGQEKLAKDLRKQTFYVVVFRKVGMAKEMPDKTILLPQAVTKRGNGKVVELGDREEELDDIEASVRIINVDTKELRGRDIGLATDAVIKSLAEGLSNSEVLRAKAENEGLITEFKNDISAILGEVIYDGIKTVDYLECESRKELKDKIITLLKYEDSDYTDEIGDEFLEVLGELDSLKKFLNDNINEFIEKTTFIKENVEHVEGLASTDRNVFNRIIGYEVINLSLETLKEVRDIYEKINAIIKTKKKRQEEDTAHQKYTDDNWQRFSALQILIRKYQLFGEKFNNKKVVQMVLSVRKEGLTPEIVLKAETLEKTIVRQFSGSRIRFETLKELEDWMKKLVRYKDNDFMFSINDISFLDKLKEEWNKDVLTDSSMYVINELTRFHACIQVVKDWEETVRPLIDWHEGFSVLARETSEDNYLYTLKNHILLDPFIDEKSYYGRRIYIPSRHKKEDIASIMDIEAMKCQIGQELVVTIPDNFEITADFIKAMEILGFSVKNIFKAWLEIAEECKKGSTTARKEAERCMRCQTTVLILKKEKFSDNADPALFKLISVPTPDQDYSSWSDSRFLVLQELGREDFKICSEEYLTQNQIKTMYPEWADKYLNSREWSGFLILKTAVEEAVSNYNRAEEQRKREEEIRQAERKRLKEEEERIRREREEKLIKKSDVPLVSITYNEIWTESLVRDLAHILIKIVSDFNQPPPLAEIICNPEITKHPKLGEIPPVILKEKVAELIKYRQYDMRIGQVFRELGRMAGVLLPNYINQLNMAVNIDASTVYVPYFAWNTGDNSAIWHEYQLGHDPSPFGYTDSEICQKILGQLFLVKRFEIEAEGKRLAIAGRMIKIEKATLALHILSDPSGRIKALSDKVSGLEISVGADGKFPEYDKLLLQFKQMTYRGGEESDAHKLRILYKQIKEIFVLLGDIYTNKSMKTEFINDILGLVEGLYLYIKTAEKSESEGMYFSGIIDKALFLTDNIKKMFEGSLTQDEYAAFLEEIKKRLALPQEQKTAHLPFDYQRQHDGENLFDYYMDEDGREKEVRVGKKDNIARQFAEKIVKIEYYYDLLSLFKDVELYKLSEEEKKILDQLVSSLNNAIFDDATEEIVEQIISYITASNTINRYLYFSYISIDNIWKQESIEDVHEIVETVTKAVMRVDFRVSAFTYVARRLSVPVLLLELYRLKQMAEDMSLSERVRTEVQFSIVRLINIIANKLQDPSLKLDLPELNNESADSYDIMYALASIGNKNHIDLIINVLIGLQYLKQADIYDLRFNLEFAATDVALLGVVKELQVLFLYFPEETETAIENVADAVKQVGMTQNVRRFLEIFKSYNPEYSERLQVAITRAQAKKVIDTAGMAKRQLVLLDDCLQTKKMSKELIEKIRQDQGFRCLVMTTINSFMKQPESVLRKEEDIADTIINTVIQNMSNPYEIYHLIKTFTTVSTGKQVYIDDRILELSIKRLMEFARGGMEEAVIDVLMRTDRQYYTLNDFIQYGFNFNADLRNFIGELFVKGGPKESVYAYQYISYYLKNGLPDYYNENAHEINRTMMCGLFGRGDDIDTGKMKRLIELFAISVVKDPAFSLSKEWDIVISAFKEGRISKKTLFEIERNAYWFMMDVCDEFDDPAKIKSFRDRFRIEDDSGLSIFSQAVLDKAAKEGTEEKEKEGGEVSVEEVIARLQEFVRGTAGVEIDTRNIENILRQAKAGKRVELTEKELRRLYWLISKSRDLGVVHEIARLLNIILGPDYTGDITSVIMAIEKEVLANISLEEQLARQNITRKVQELEAVASGERLVCKTVSGLRFEGPEIPERVKDTVRYVYEYRASDPVEVKTKQYVLIDEYRAREYKDIIEDISNKYGVVFIDNINDIPQGINRDEVIVLVDPSDADRYKGYRWYLPLVYNKKSFVMAALLSINKPKRHEELKDTEIFLFVKKFYGKFMKDEKLSDEEIISWFENPMLLKDKLKKYSEELKLLRIAFTQLDVSA